MLASYTADREKNKKEGKEKKKEGGEGEEQGEGVAGEEDMFSVL